MVSGVRACVTLVEGIELVGAVDMMTVVGS